VVLERPWLTASKNQKEEAMATKKKAKAKTRKKNATVTEKGADVPNLFRLNVEVGDLDEAAQFYGTLLGLVGRKQAGSRVYFTCGTVTLQVVDVSSVGAPHPAAKALSFTVSDLDAIFERAKSLNCLSKEDVHGVPGGAISVRPWGERSFYAEDRWQNPLCFVEAGTIYPG
jgi:catechol 2,3-dioxygenase-like lactoylglutathione lyase family enzyme